jgi:hypothetical protein
MVWFIGERDRDLRRAPVPHIGPVPQERVLGAHQPCPEQLGTGHRQAFPLLVVIIIIFFLMLRFLSLGFFSLLVGLCVWMFFRFER